MIAAETLRDQVRSAAPFLFEQPLPEEPRDPAAAAAEPRGWLSLVVHAPALAARAEPEAYFAVCLACHHASVGSFVPTDVDGKIRGRLWQPRSANDSAWLRRQAALALQAGLTWSLDGVAARWLPASAWGGAPGARPLSGHAGEYLAVWAGALAAAACAGDGALADRVEAALEEELARQAAAFETLRARRGAELDLLRAAALLTHNQGDVDQALSFWPRHPRLETARTRLSDLAHSDAFGGSFRRAAVLYAALLAPEGHRHYPLRAVRALRRSPDLLLPLGPFFDDWGGCLARHPALSEDERSEAAAALLAGCAKIPGQAGYYRALAGLDGALPRGLEGLARRLPTSARAQLKNAELRRRVALPRASFESSYAKRARALVDGNSG